MKKILLMTILCITALPASAFSAYENRMRFADAQRIGLIALAKPEQLLQLQQMSQMTASEQQKLANQGINNLMISVRQIKDQLMVFAYFESANKSITGWGAKLTQALPKLSKLSQLLKPHLRADKQSVWLRMEWMNLIASREVFPVKGKKVQPMALMSGLKPEFELTYRQLHQSNWPAVVDTMVKSNYRNWTSFLIELDQQLYLFTYAEYIGHDIKTDNQQMAKDPVTQRWWNNTEQCLINLHGQGNWSGMQPILETQP